MPEDDLVPNVGRSLIAGRVLNDELDVFTFKCLSLSMISLRSSIFMDDDVFQNRRQHLQECHVTLTITNRHKTLVWKTFTGSVGSNLALSGFLSWVCQVLLTPVHYTDVIMTTIASQITSPTVVYSIVHADQRKHRSSASLAFVRGSHRDRWIPGTKSQQRGKSFHLMTSSWNRIITYTFRHRHQ